MSYLLTNLVTKTASIYTHVTYSTKSPVDIKEHTNFIRKSFRSTLKDSFFYKITSLVLLFPLTVINKI